MRRMSTEFHVNCWYDILRVVSCGSSPLKMLTVLFGIWSLEMSLGVRWGPGMFDLEGLTKLKPKSASSSLWVTASLSFYWVLCKVCDFCSKPDYFWVFWPYWKVQQIPFINLPSIFWIYPCVEEVTMSKNAWSHNPNTVLQNLLLFQTLTETEAHIYDED